MINNASQSWFVQTTVSPQSEAEGRCRLQSAKRSREGNQASHSLNNRQCNHNYGTEKANAAT